MTEAVVWVKPLYRTTKTLLSLPGWGCAHIARLPPTAIGNDGFQLAASHLKAATIRFPERLCRKRFESRLTPWAAISVHRSLSPARRSH